jgi:PIN domain nuclease of toxin-antitoxin system
VIALDTHAAIWWTLEPARLSRRARQAIDDADRIGLSSIVFWEVALLSRRRRIDLRGTVGEWVREVLSLPRVESHLVTPEIALEAEELPMHADPGDRFIVASARKNGCPLVTRDVAIRRGGLTPVIW